MLFRAYARDTVRTTPYAGNRPSDVTCPYPGRHIAVQHKARHNKPLRVVACAGRPLQLCFKPISLQFMSQLYPTRRNHHQELAALKETLAALPACALWHMQADDEIRFFFRAHARDTVLDTPFTSNRPSNVTCPYPGRQIAVQHGATHHIPLRVVACADRPLQLCIEPIRMPLMSELHPPRHNHFQELAVLKQTQAALSACALWRMQADASSRCFSELMRARRCTKRHMPETGQAVIYARILGAKLQCSTHENIVNHCAWAFALADLSSCASNPSACHQ